MGLHLIAAADPSWATWTLNVLWVLIGLNLVIFVHELGHFAVARLCGVKCEKFYIWLDIGGLRFCRFKWGETEYGLGVFPLGGYVKMLGQEDNPSRLREEIERAKALSENDQGPSPSPTDASRGTSSETDSKTQEPAEPIDLKAAEEALYDPRSYLAQSVPKRMAIISAGVIMNVVMAWVAAVIAYGVGVRHVECAVGDVFPGEAAWKADFKVGDRIEEIAGNRVYRFKDLQRAVSLGDIDDGVPVVLRRPGVEEPVRLTVHPDNIRGIPTIGISSSYIPTLRKDLPVLPGSSAARAKPEFQAGDQIVAINGKPIESYVQIHAQLALHPEEDLLVTVQREAKPSEDVPSQESHGTRRVDVEVEPAPMRRLGLVMKMGPITAVQDNSPAAAAKIRPGDVLLRIDERPAGDPMTLPDRLRRLAEKDQPVTLTLSRKGQGNPIDVRLKLRRADCYEQASPLGGPLSAPALGIAYQVGNRVEAIQPNSPAAGQVKPGDVVVRATLIPPDEEDLSSLGIQEAARGVNQKEVTLDFTDTDTWPLFCHALQQTLPHTRVKLELGGDRTVTLEPVEAADWFNPDRGFIFEPKDFRCKAQSFADAVALGTQETVESLLMVFRFIRKLGSQVSPRMVGGPWTIAKVAYYSATEGMGQFLVFLCLISANLAVINFLPIPVLDGGHMIFLAYEGIRGKPPSERVHVTLSYLGLFFILGLMIWVLGLDFGLIARQ